MNHSKQPVISEIVSEHACEASFLWLQRTQAVGAPNYSPQQFADLDERLEAHIDGLRVAGEEGLRISFELLDDEEPENFFPAAVLALEADGERFDELVQRASQSPEVTPGLVSGLDWVSAQFLGGRVKAYIEDASPLKQKLGIAACAFHRKDPGSLLAEFLNSSVDSVRIRAMRAAGDLGRKDLLQPLQSSLVEVKPEARFWAARSAVLLGDRNKAIEVLIDMALQAGSRQQQALQLALLAMEMKAGNELLSRLSGIPNERRLRIIGAGYLGSVKYVSWLIEQMKIAELARIAGDAVVNITGADFNLDQLEAMPPEGFEDGPTEDPDDEVVELPEDIVLPWPDVERIQKWWDKHRFRFKGNARYFLGQPATSAHCMNVLKEGFQCQRIAAAQQLCLLKPGTVLFPTSAPAWRQKRWLEKLAP